MSEPTNGRWPIKYPLIFGRRPLAVHAILDLRPSAIGHRSSVIGHRSSVIGHRSSLKVPEERVEQRSQGVGRLERERGQNTEKR